MVSIESEISLLVASLATMFLSFRQYSLSWEEGRDRKSVNATQLSDFTYLNNKKIKKYTVIKQNAETHFVIKDVVHPAWGLWAVGLWETFLWNDAIFF